MKRAVRVVDEVTKVIPERPEPAGRGKRLRHDLEQLVEDLLQKTVDPVRKALAATTHFAGVTGTISYRRGSRIPAKSVSIISVNQGRQSLAASVLPEQIPAP